MLINADFPVVFPDVQGRLKRPLAVADTAWRTRCAWFISGPVGVGWAKERSDVPIGVEVRADVMGTLRFAHPTGCLFPVPCSLSPFFVSSVPSWWKICLLSENSEMPMG
jgi:hypothetical protein